MSVSTTARAASTVPGRVAAPRYVDLVGGTPLIDLTAMLPDEVQAHGLQLLAKAEFCNPGFSMKDRIITRIFDRAEETGQLRPGQVVVCASSGNTGAACAMICAARGTRRAAAWIGGRVLDVAAPAVPTV